MGEPGSLGISRIEPDMADKPDWPDKPNGPNKPYAPWTA